MINVSIEIGEKELLELDALCKEFPKETVKVARNAINRTAQWVNTRVIRGITSHLDIKRKDIVSGAHRYGGVHLQKATVQSLEARIDVTGKRIPLYRFKARGPKRPRRGDRGVGYRITKRGARKYIPSAFIATMKSGHVGVFKRTSTKSLPIIELFGPSIPHVAEQMPELRRMLDIDASETLQRSISQQIDWLLERKGVNR